MGWFWGTSDSKGSGSSLDDPLRNLDPTLRDFLAKESPVKYSSTNPPASSQAVPEAAPQPGLQSVPGEQSSENDAEVPPESLFKDGRYANLWSTYQPQAEVDATFKSDAEKISDILEGYKERKAEIGRAALENCAMEQWDVNECFRSGGVVARLTMCRVENRKFERCYTVQAKFLKALGYLSTYDRPKEVDEQIQMHADTLYHRMLDQEAAIEAAKTEGGPIPSFPPLVSAPVSDALSKSSTRQLEKSNLAPGIQAKLKKRLEGLDEKEREVEEQAIKAEIQAGEEVVGSLGNIYQKQLDEKKLRKDQGRETMGDRLASIFKWN